MYALMKWSANNDGRRRRKMKRRRKRRIVSPEYLLQGYSNLEGICMTVGVKCRQEYSVNRCCYIVGGWLYGRMGGHQ